jgi:RNA polymerase sigma-70 factor (ECF subfamily)
VNDARTTPSQPGAGASPPPAEDARTLDALVDVHAQRAVLLRLAYRLLWNLDDAEDAVQSALLLATERRDQLADASRVWPWMRAIVVRQCMDVRRRRQRDERTQQRTRESQQTTTQAPDVLAALADNEMNARMRAAISQLPERQQAAIVLRHLEEMSYVEIAGVLGVTESTVRVQVRNARENLCRIMKAGQ